VDNALAGTHLQASNDDALVGRLRQIASDAIQIEKRTSRVNLEKVAITRIGSAEIEASPDGIALGVQWLRGRSVRVC
jgi:hypothetical protein